MADSVADVEKRDAIRRTYNACKMSLQIINEVSMATSSSNASPHELKNPTPSPSERNRCVLYIICHTHLNVNF